MKKSLTTLISGIILALVSGQAQQVISTLGGYGSTPEASVSWTLGETFFQTGSQGGLFNVVGFQQPVYSENQTIALPSGWSMFSTYLHLFRAGADEALFGLPGLILAKDENGSVYFPGFQLNTIGNLEAGEGYQILTNQPGSLNLTGVSQIPPLYPTNVPAQWSLLGYMRKEAGPVATMFAGIGSNLHLAKSRTGAIYWPDYQIDMIGNLVPGQAYQIKALAPQVFYYPPNSGFPAKAVPQVCTTHFPAVTPCGQNMTLCIPLEAWNEVPEVGDELGVFSARGHLVGSAQFAGGHTALTLWGYEPEQGSQEGLANGEAFVIRLFKRDKGFEQELTVSSWLTGEGAFETNRISIVGQFSPGGEESLCTLFPNPASQFTSLAVDLNQDSRVSIRFLNATGQTVGPCLEQVLPAGKSQVPLELTTLVPGIYQVVVAVDQHQTCLRLVVVR